MTLPEPLDARQLQAHGAFLRRLAAGLLGDGQAADDAVQAAYLKALERPPGRPAALRSWLARVVRHEALQSLRGEGRRRRREESVARAEALDAADPARGPELQRRVCELLCDLPEVQRTVLYLRYYEGLGPSRIAQHLGVPVKTVKSRHTRALAQLRDRLDGEYGGRERWAVLMAGIAPGSAAPLAGILAVTLVAASLTGLAVWLGSAELDPQDRGTAAHASLVGETTAGTKGPVVLESKVEERRPIRVAQVSSGSAKRPDDGRATGGTAEERRVVFHGLQGARTELGPSPIWRTVIGPGHDVLLFEQESTECLARASFRAGLWTFEDVTPGLAHRLEVWRGSVQRLVRRDVFAGQRVQEHLEGLASIQLDVRDLHGEPADFIVSFAAYADEGGGFGSSFSRKAYDELQAQPLLRMEEGRVNGLLWGDSLFELVGNDGRGALVHVRDLGVEEHRIVPVRLRHAPLRVRVVDDRGAPVSEAEVVLFRRSSVAEFDPPCPALVEHPVNGRDLLPSAWLSARRVSGKAPVHPDGPCPLKLARTDRDGRANFQGFVPELVQLALLTKAGYGELIGPLSPEHLNGEEQVLVLPASATLAGRVMPADELQFLGTSHLILHGPLEAPDRNQEPGQFIAELDEYGAYRVTDLPPGEYSLLLPSWLRPRTENEIVGHVQVTPGANTFDVILERTGRALIGFELSPEAEGLMIGLSASAGETVVRGGVVESGGRTLPAEISSGTWFVSAAQGNAWAVEIGQVSVSDRGGDEPHWIPLDLEVHRGRVRLVDGDGRPLQRRFVKIYARGAVACVDFMRRTDAEGWLEVRLPDGPFTIYPVPPGEKPRPWKPLEVGARGYAVNWGAEVLGTTLRP